MNAVRRPKISVHRERVPFAPNSRFYKTNWHVHIGGERFATIYGDAGIPHSWRVHVLAPNLWSGDFYGLADARPWALEMARRKLDPSRGPIVSTRTQYGAEQRLTPEEA
jgi:hypothetical protein